ncbi:beta-1,3-galactosyltransferase 1 [Episyrphus balteatus]|uniref:beta-1,3-galactosyltransferase 1 n=1 Tax=Episyrphus balteatus TaxID=286459 RepID=UPI002484EB22|nr:beta-1,3-galactosyltransferase 1 [Episyrphus balteatus]XP_055847177.1 beta-1,3-galactosyltransferase 1 [Episyrphus balteatus]XP_055847178.1 beta-1,3-galactosyltransferase 1 [Episyrphus balteatus]XP_055847179.1 beta-1,3-galactosyltransferase 1 [Episyrphus balteatus]XP_055847181.1 beta-1,3-galactosyltransferase 1 [Episyrphus balteatus]
MFERRRPILGLLIGLTLCISIWRISVQESAIYATEFSYGSSNQLAYDDHRPSPTAYEFKHIQPEPPEFHHHQPLQHRTNQGRSYSIEPGHHQHHHTTPLNSDTSAALGGNNLSLVSFTSSSSSSATELPFDNESLPADDYSTLIDFRDFKFLINQVPCARTNTAYFLILIHSAPANDEKRQVIRETWGSVRSPHLRLLFLVGAVKTNKLQHQLDVENTKFSDLIQGNFVDDYRNMTYKHVMALKWFIYFCPKAKYLVKTDDDVFVNTLQLLEYVDLQRQHQRPIMSPFTPRTYNVPSSSSSSSPDNTSHILNVLQPKNFLFCQRLAEARVKRSYRSKWRVSGKEYAGRYYPPYCPGYSIVYSPDVVFRLYKEAQHSKYFWIDDVHITGTLAQNSNITITSFWPWRMHPGAYDDILSGKTDIGHYLFFFAWANISERQIRDLWAMTFGHFNSTRSNGGVGAASSYKYDSFR